MSHRVTSVVARGAFFSYQLSAPAISLVLWPFCYHSRSEDDHVAFLPHFDAMLVEWYVSNCHRVFGFEWSELLFTGGCYLLALRHAAQQ